jgi:hypothetical protein
VAACSGANAINRIASEPIVPGTPPAAASSFGGRDANASAKKPDGSKEEWWQEGGVTREKINAMCWMKYEKGRRDISVDKRADLVNDCVQQTLKDHPPN